MSTPAIPGLPPGAIVKPLGGRTIEGLPPGAVVKPLGAPAPTAAPAPAPPAQPAGDPGILHGIMETTPLMSMWDEVKQRFAASKEQKDFPTVMEESFTENVKNNPMLGGGLRMIGNIAREAYEQGRQAAQHAGRAVSQEWQGVKSLAQGDIRGASAHGAQVGNEMLEATGHAGAAALPVVGPAAAKAGTDIGEGRPKEGIGEGIGLVAQIALGGSLKRKATKGQKPLELNQAVDDITDAVNPAPDYMPTFREHLGEQVGRVTDYAQRNKIDLATGGRKSFLKAARGAGEEAQEFYNKNILEPVQDRLAPNGETYGALEARLRHLNRTTSYKATSAAESEVQIARKAEAASIRETLNQGLAKELGISPDDVAAARSAGERLQQLADHTELAMDIERHATNAQERSSITLHASHGGAIPGTPVGGGRFSAKVTRASNKMFGHPADNKINNAFKRLQAPAPAINPQVQPKNSPPRTPVWKANPQEPATVGGRDFTPDVEGARAKLDARKAQGDATKLSREMEAAAEALRRKETRERHPLARNAEKETPKTRVNGSSESDGSMEAIQKQRSDRAKGIEYVIKTRGGTYRPVMKTALRPEDNALNPGESLWKKHPDGHMEKVK